MRRLVAAVLAAAAPLAAPAADARWHVQLDNDAGFDTDRWYSSGARLARIAARDGHELEWGLLHEVYTPEAKRFAHGVIDRAPAARLLATIARHDRAGGVFQTLEAGLGVRGPAAHGEAVTDFVHRVIAAHEVDWSREGPNRLDAQAAAVRSHALAPAGLDSLGVRHFEVHYGAVLGTQLAFAHAGAAVRFGAGAPSALLRFAASPPGAGAAHGWGAFAGVSVRAVGRNRLLDTPYEEGAPALERRRGVARFAVGASLTRAWGALALALAQETREFAGQRTPHRFGSLSFAFAF